MSRFGTTKTVRHSAAKRIPARRGATYVIVLMTTMIVAAIGMGGLLVVRAQTRVVDSYTRTAMARQNALSAIELGRQEIASNPNWRTAHKNDPGGTWFDAQPIGGGTYTLKVVNPQGSLDRAPNDPVVLTGIGTAHGGHEQQIVEVTLVPEITPKTCLQTAETSGSTISLGTSTIWAMNAALAANASGTAVTSGGGGAKVYARIEAVGTVTGNTFYNGATSGVPPRTLPDPATAFDYYLAHGTPISVTSLPISGGGRAFTGQLLTPTNNPYGPTNPEGIYVLDCLNQVVTFSQNRIVGTVVLLNPSAGGTTLYKTQNYHVPAVPNYPSLMVRGDFQVQLTTSDLLESTLKVNFNPVNNPYPWGGGTTDTDTTDVYPNRIEGLVYVSGNMWTQTNAAVGMLIVGGAITHQNGSLNLTYNPVYYHNPPHGFYTLKMVSSPGSWLWKSL